MKPTEMIETWRSHHLFDVRIDAITMEQVLDAAGAAVAQRHRLLVGVVNAAKLVNMRRDPLLRRAVLGADVIVADGMSVVWACRMLLRRLPERVAGIDLMTRLLARASQEGWRVYCLGATDEVLEALQDRIRREYPGLKLVGARNGYFTEEQQEEVATSVAQAKPDLLFAGMSSPKKEQFLADWAAVMDVPVCHGVGGAFDVLAGKVSRAPVVLQRMGLEWLYRVLQEPKRLWKRYLYTNVVFMGACMIEVARQVVTAVVGTNRVSLARRPAGIQA